MMKVCKSFAATERADGILVVVVDSVKRTTLRWYGYVRIPENSVLLVLRCAIHD